MSIFGKFFDNPKADSNPAKQEKSVSLDDSYSSFQERLVDNKAIDTTPLIESLDKFLSMLVVDKGPEDSEDFFEDLYEPLEEKEKVFFMKDLMVAVNKFADTGGREIDEFMKSIRQVFKLHKIYTAYRFHKNMGPELEIILKKDDETLWDI